MKLVDTSAWVEFLRRKGDADAKLAVARMLEAEECAYTCPVRFELLSGARPEEEADLIQVLALSKHVLFEAEDWRQAAFLERKVRARGMTIPRNDLFVATVAIRTGLRLACRDVHFTQMERVLGGSLKIEQV